MLIRVQNGVVCTSTPGFESPASDVVKRVIEAHLRTPNHQNLSVHDFEASLEYKNAILELPATSKGTKPFILLTAHNSFFSLLEAELTPTRDGEVVSFSWPPIATGADRTEILEILGRIPNGQMVSDQPYSMPHHPW